MKSGGRIAKIILNTLIGLLTATMLLLAAVYVGGTRFARNFAALNSTPLNEGSMAVGHQSSHAQKLHEKELLKLTFAGVKYSGVGGGAYGVENAAEDILEFASRPLHDCLGATAKLSPSTKESFVAAAGGDFVYIELLSPLPYQMIYALTGEGVAAAGSDTAINADRLLLAFLTDGTTSLYLSDGSSFFEAKGEVHFRQSELSALAKDTRLHDFAISGSALAVCSTASSAKTLKAERAEAPTGNTYREILLNLGFTADSTQPSYIAVEPHGTLRVSSQRIAYNAAVDGGLPVSDYLDAAKVDIDIDIYDILTASVYIAETLRDIAPNCFGNDTELYLDGFYLENGVYTLVLGISEGSIKIFGDAYPYFAKFTVQNGRFKSIDIRLLSITKSATTSPLLPSAWEYSYASKNAEIHTFCPIYKLDSFGGEALSAQWYYTGIRRDAK